ncbi:CehA/McbA family metallohydrolase [Pedobacter frigidisoli]|uniref:CehA/McbA family metallohydrolase n=1 Tax=Pedobacter frigidisoli TaxID=2530455 RepID=UPI00292F26A3|nr:CehA/McbA family metallohydrolase [Pedobacter frigidisoli]
MKKILLLFLIIVFYFPTVTIAQIASWDFTGQTMVATSTANKFDAGLTAAPVLTRGTTAPASAGNNSFRTQGFLNNGISTANTDYFQVTLTASAGKQISLSSLDALFAGTATYYASPGVSSQYAYSLNGTSFTLIGSPNSITAATVAPAASPTVNLSGIAALQNVQAGTTITIRYYASGQTATGGWGFNSPAADRAGFSIGGTITASGTVDTTPPTYASGYPKTSLITSTTVNLTSNINEAGKTYYVLVPATGTAPTTPAQIKAGKDGNNNDAFKSGSFANALGVDASTTIAGLTLSTAYRIYVTAEDAAATPNLQTSFSTLSFSTLGAADVTPPVTAATYPKTSNVTTTSVDFTNNINEAGTTYYVLALTTTTAPTAAQVKAGQDGTGATGLKSGNFTNTANTDASASITGLSVGTSYTLYVVAQDAAANLQTVVSSVDATTANPPLVSAPVIISQYYEGTSVNKWIELTNLSNAPVNTASPQLKLALYNISGDAGNINITGTPSQIVNLNFTIPAQGTILLGNTGNGTEVTYLSPASAILNSNTVINFNGNDGVALLDANNNIIDAFGQGVNAKDVSYVRSLNVTAPSPAFIESDWTRTPIATVQNAIDDDDADRLGVHFPPNLPVCSAPTVAATSLTFTGVTTGSITGNFVKSTDANEYLIIRSLNTTLTALPVDGTAYAIGSSFGGGIVVNKIVANTFTDNNLTSSTNYTYFIIPLNNLSCTGGPKYLTSNILSGTQTTRTLLPCTTPAAQPTNFTITSSNYNFIQAAFTPNGPSDEYLVVMSTVNSLSANPVNQTVYNVGDMIGGGVVVKRGAGGTFIRNGLTQNTNYYFFVYAVNSACAGGPLYLTGQPLQGTFKTGILDVNKLNFYYGNLHSHSSYSDGNKDDLTKKPEDDYAFAKNSMNLDFLGISEHNHTQAGMSLANWQPGIDAAKKATTSNFVALHGMEWGVISGGGHVIVYGIDSLIGWESGENQIYVPKSVYTGSTGLFRIINRHGLNAVATLAHPNTTDFNNISATYDLSADSAIVGTALESGPAFSTNTTYSDPASSMSYLSYYNRMLARGYHLGASIDHDNHNLTFGRHTRARLVVLAPALTENDLLDAIKKMRFYASQDSAAKIVFTINKQPVGSVFKTAGAPLIEVNSITTSPVTSIKILYGTPGSGVNPVELTTSSSTNLTYTDNALANLATGYYYADILEADGSRIITSPIWYSRDDATVKKNQNITFTATKTVTYGDPDFAAGATSDNTAINITYTSSDTNIATITNSDVHILKAGTVTITANQPGDTFFNPALAKQQILTISPKTITVTADAKTKVESTVDPAFTFTSTPTLVGADTFTGNLTRIGGETAGDYAITQGTLGLNTNYAINYRPANLHIYAKPVATLSAGVSAPLNGTAPVITFTAAAGTAPFTFTYNINNGSSRTLTSTTNTATVTAPTTAVGTFVYTITSIRDAYSTQVQNVSTTVTIRPLPLAAVSGTTSVCNFSSSPQVTFTGSNGTAPYTFTYTVNGSSNRTVTASGTTATVSAPTGSAGTFEYSLVSVTDAYASQTQTGTATVVVNPLPVITINSNKGISISKGDAVVLTATGGTQYSWTGADVVSGQNTAALTIRPKQSGTYRVVVTNASGCISDQSISITVIDDYKLEASTLVTPNGDGYNDKFIIKNIDYYPNNKVTIFDKTGRVLYTKQTYANDWDGMVNGSPLAEGTYYYIVDLGTGIGTFKGFINIIRN